MALHTGTTIALGIQLQQQPERQLAMVCEQAQVLNTVSSTLDATQEVYLTPVGHQGYTLLCIISSLVPSMHRGKGSRAVAVQHSQSFLAPTTVLAVLCELCMQINGHLQLTQINS